MRLAILLQKYAYFLIFVQRALFFKKSKNEKVFLVPLSQ